MHIEHVAVWTQQLDVQKNFYEKYFSAHAGQKYVNPKIGFESYFLTFETGARLELMQAPDVVPSQPVGRIVGYVHMAISVGSRERVDQLTQRLESDGYRVMSQPRVTGDGYYESVVLDPDGNQIEITI